MLYLPYIKFNNDLRAKAVSKSFEEDHFKLMNNAVFGKTMEDAEKRLSVALVRRPEVYKIRRLIANSPYISRKIFTGDLAATLGIVILREFLKTKYIPS